MKKRISFEFYAKKKIIQFHAEHMCYVTESKPRFLAGNIPKGIIYVAKMKQARKFELHYCPLTVS